jgi:hypothetical protein
MKLVPKKVLNLMNFKLKSERLNFSLMDDTGFQEYPLFNLNFNRIEMDM